MVGKVFIGRYEILERLGSGGMAVVYKAKDNVLHRTVTIKILQEQFANNEDFILRFRREAQAVAALSHINIVHVFDVGYSEGVHYLIMEYIEGRTLKEVIQKQGSLSMEVSLDYVSQILSGLAHAHAYGVIHRDIKPQNIMVTNDNRVKIMDFGLALNMTDSTITYDNSILGSVYYIAPEIAQKGSGDARADIYAAGVVLYEMLTGELPFSGDSPISIALQHVEGKYTPVDELNEEIPFEVARLVDKAMAKDPLTRYQSAKKMMRDIEKVAEEYDIALPNYISGSDLGVPLTSNGGKAHRILQRDEYEDADLDLDEDILPVKKVRTKKPEKNSANEKPGAKGKKTREQQLKKVAIIVAIAIFLLAIGGYAFIRIFTSTDEVEVPLLEGKDVTEATEMLDQLKLTYQINTVASSEVEVDIVITQSIKAGQKVKVGREVTLTVSSGAKTVTLTSLIGKTQAAAEQALDDLGLTYSIETSTSSSVEEGKVISHSPGPQSEVAVGSKVVLTVSAGPEVEEATVPSVIGLTLSDAQSLLENRGLTVGKVSEESRDDVSSGIVFYQSISANTTVEKGSTVNISVSTGSSSKSVTVEYTVPAGNTDVTISIVVDDASGKSTVHSGTYSEGDTIKKTVTVAPPGDVIVLLDGTEVLRKVVS